LINKKIDRFKMMKLHLTLLSYLAIVQAQDEPSTTSAGEAGTDANNAGGTETTDEPSTTSAGEAGTDANNAGGTVTTDAEPEVEPRKPTAWNNWEGGVKPDPIFDVPMDQKITYPEGEKGNLCWATQGLPLNTEYADGQMPRFCEYGPNDKYTSRCCTTTQDVYIKNFNQLEKWPTECAA